MKGPSLVMMTILMAAILSCGHVMPICAQGGGLISIKGPSGQSVRENVWLEVWTWTAPVKGPVMFDTRGSDVDTVLLVFSGSRDNATEVVRNDVGETLQSGVRFTAQQDQVYYVGVRTRGRVLGTIVLNWRPSLAGETFIASVEVDIPGPDGLRAVGREITWIAPAPEVDGFTKGWHHNRNSGGDLHGLQISVGDTEIVVEQWLNGVRQATASYRGGEPLRFNSYTEGELDGVQYGMSGEENWVFATTRDGALHGPFGSYVGGEPGGIFGTFSDGELEGLLHTINEEGWVYEVYEDDTRHGPFGTYNADGQKDGPFGIYTKGRKDPGEVYWTNGQREPETKNSPPLPRPNVPEEITFYPSVTETLYLAGSNMFFWDPDGDTLQYFVSSEPPGMFNTLPDGSGSLYGSRLTLNSGLTNSAFDPSASLGTSGRATVTACDPDGLCAEITFKVVVQPEFVRRDPGDFLVEAAYCKTPLVENHRPVAEIEICAHDLDYEDGDRVALRLRGRITGYDNPPSPCNYDACLDFDPLLNSWSCKTVQVQGIGSIGTLQYYLEVSSDEISWWDWDWITQPLCQAGWSPDCFVGPELFDHPGTEVHRGELIVRSRIDGGRVREWQMRGREAYSEGMIGVRFMGLEPEDPRCAEDSGTVEFRITDACDDSQAIHSRLFQNESSGTPWTAQWPSERDYYYVAQSYNVESFVRVPCPAGQRVCYGAESADGQQSWGVGLGGNESCSGCCRSCPDNGDANFVRRLGCSQDAPPSGQNARVPNGTTAEVAVTVRLPSSVYPECTVYFYKGPEVQKLISDYVQESDDSILGNVCPDSYKGRQPVMCKYDLRDVDPDNPYTLIARLSYEYPDPLYRRRAQSYCTGAGGTLLQ